MRAQLKQLRALSAELLAMPAIDGQIRELTGKIETAMAKIRDGKPLDARLASASAHVPKMESLEAEA
eukprot:12421655-Karenia_brevis.AAC.1